MAQLPEKIGRYEIESLLGRGAMGVVYLGKDPSIGRRVAIKVLDLSLAPTERVKQDFAARFGREAQAAGRLNHPNIVTVYEAGYDDKLQCSYIAMEYLPGQRLDEKIAAGPVPIDAAINILYEISVAIDYAHQQKVIHRDLKPQNICLTPAGLVKIMDFGIARLEASELTHAGEFLGTPAYMSPEQANGQSVDHRSDLFALGILAYELLTGQRPFTAESVTGILQKIALHHPDPPSHLRDGVPRALDRVVLKLLEKDPARRYQDGASVAMELVRLKPTQLAIEEVPVDPLATVTRPQPPPQHGAGGRAALSPWLPVALVVGALVIAAALFVRRPAPAEAVAAAGSSPRSAANSAPLDLRSPGMTPPPPKSAAGRIPSGVSAPKPAATHSAPGKSAPLRGSAVSAAATNPPAAAIGSARLHLRFEKPKRGGTYTVLVDGRSLLQLPYGDALPPLVARELPLAAGSHTLTLVFNGSDGKELSRENVSIAPVAGSEITYSVRIGGLFNKNKLLLRKG